MRLIVLLLTACLITPCLWAGLARAGVSVTDDAGRVVTLDHPAGRIVLTDGMGLLGLMLIDRDPVARLAGWNRGRLDESALRALAPRLPGLDAVPDIGEPERNGSPEALLALHPDLVVLDPYYNRSPATLALFEAAGVPVAVLALTPSFREAEPNAGLIRLGTLIGREAEARAYAAYADAIITTIRARVTGIAPADRPSVLLEAHAGRGACCMSVGAGPGIGDFIAVAGGRNIGAETIPGMAGMLSAEYLLTRAPDVYVGTGGAYLAAAGGLVLGPGTDAAAARAALAGVTGRPGLAETPAVLNGRVHGVWHGLAVSAMNVVLLQALAVWLHPDLFPDMDPARTMAEINDRFMAAPLEGALTVSLEGR